MTKPYPHFSEIDVRFVQPDGLAAGAWVLHEALMVDVAPGWTVTIPAGTKTDFATIPRWLWPVYPPTGPWAPAAVLHDWLYAMQGFPRHVADAWFLAGMHALRVPWWRRWILYLAVRLFGGAFRRKS